MMVGEVVGVVSTGIFLAAKLTIFWANGCRSHQWKRSRALRPISIVN